MREFITALRQLQRPLVMLAAAILVLQALVAGLANGHIAAQIATFGADAVLICHNSSDDGSVPVGKAIHDCCAFCGNPGPVALSADTSIIHRLEPVYRGERADNSSEIRPTGRAIRAGPSQAPPTVA